MFKSSTNTVQAFLRTLAWVVTFLLVGGLLVPALGSISATIFDVFWIFGIPALLFTVWVAGIISKMIFVLPEWDRIVLLRLGKYDSVRGAGFFIIPPFIYSVASTIDTRIVVQQVEATNTLTQDNVPTKVTAAVEFKVEDPRKATIDVYDYRSSVIWLATEALKNTIGSLDLKELLSERERIAESLKVQIDESAAKYGVDVQAVRITDIDTPPSLVEELAVIARAQRATEAKRIQAEGEIIVANKLAQASEILRDGKAMKLRELQILNEMSKEESSMVIVYPYGDIDGKQIAGASAGAISGRNQEINKKS